MAKKIKMLIADDSLANRMILYDEFKLEYDVILACDGAECLDLLQKNPDVGIVVLDLVMPNIDGFKVLRKMQSHEDFCAIPVFAITSSDRTDDLVTALDMGAFDVMTKPLNIAILRHKIWNMIARTAEMRDNNSSELIRQMAENTEIDEKTGIYNKRTFCRKAHELLVNNPQKRYVITRMDIDGFKVLNDVYGYDECDRILKVIGDRFRAMDTSHEVVYGRWEADHFVTCMELDDFNSMHVENSMDKPFEGRFDFEIVTRIGVYVVEDHNLDVSLMSDRSLLALKSIKNNFSKHIAFYDDSMRQEMLERQQIVNEMKVALESKQFVVYYQPQYNYETKTLHGAEALVRWKHPEKGLIPPFKFIPVFEENGFITHLDQYVWEEVCRFQRECLDEGCEIVPVSVNVSRTDIASMKLYDFFQKLIAKYDLPTSAIRIEITESAYMDAPGQLIDAVVKLREAGFSVEMDDFGSGYSSLNTLKDVPVDMLKLDMKFVDEGIGNESRGGNILSSVVRMSRWLRLPVLAEGVETKNQADYLKSIGCVYMQGYYFAKPMPADEYRLTLEAGNFEVPVVTTKNKEVDDALQFLNASTQATLLFNSFVGGAAIIEYDGRVVDAVRINDKFFEIVHTTRSYYMSRCLHLLDDFDQINREKFIRMLERCIASHEEASCEMCSTAMKSGQEIWTRASVRLLATNVDRYLFYLSIENITQRMNLLVNNLRLTDQLTSIINNVPCGIVDIEVDSEGKWKLLYFNDKLAQMFGYSREEYEREFAGEPLASIYPEDTAAAISILRSMYEGVVNSISVRFRHICQDGSWKWVEMIVGKTRRSGELMYATGSVSDLDSRIKSEQRALNKERESARRQQLMDSVLETLSYGFVQFTYNMGRFDFSDCNDYAWQVLKYENKRQFMNGLLFADYKMDIVDGKAEEVTKAIEDMLGGTGNDTIEIDFKVRGYDGSEIMLHNVFRKIICNNEIEYIQHIYKPIG